MRLSQAIFPIVISRCFRILLPDHLLSVINSIRGDRGIREKNSIFNPICPSGRDSPKFKHVSCNLRRIIVNLLSLSIVIFILMTLNYSHIGFRRSLREDQWGTP
jgi:hypothetical protein